MSLIGAARRARGIGLDEIAKGTRISPHYVRAIDEGRFADLPPGIYARAYVRTVGAFVGLDDAQLEGILPASADTDAQQVLEEIRAARPDRPRRFTPARVHAAASLDAAVLLLLNVLVVSLVAGVCRVGAHALVSTAPLPLLVFCAMIWMTYFIILKGVNGRTMGELACGIAPRRPPASLSLEAIMWRTVGIESHGTSAPAAGSEPGALHQPNQHVRAPGAPAAVCRRCP